MKLKGKKIVMLVGPGYEDLEFWVVYMRMLEEGADIKIVGLEKGEEYRTLGYFFLKNGICYHLSAYDEPENFADNRKHFEEAINSFKLRYYLYEKRSTKIR